MSRSSVLKVLVAVVFISASAHAAPPELVSPVGLSADRCPTFSWSAVPRAGGYELVVYRVAGEEMVSQTPLLSVRLPGGAAAWTPPSKSCLAAGGRYAWTLRALGGEAGEGSWSEPALFEVEAAPSSEEVQAAIATLRRYLGEARGEAVAKEKVGEDRSGARRGAAGGGRPGEPAATSGEKGSGLKSVTAASVPSLGSPSLTVDANVALGAGSNLFKDGSVFLWDDTTGNTALGRAALASATGMAAGNTAVGSSALRYTVEGASVGYGSFNTAIGLAALRTNTTGASNTANGFNALLYNTTGNGNSATGAFALLHNSTGSSNTASGSDALFSNTTGFRNTASGAAALYSNTTGFYNSAMGQLALLSNTYGAYNTASGSHALRSNTEGVRNTATGFAALLVNTTGSNNTATGNRALYYSTTGSRNTAVGNGAGSSLVTGNDNIFLGSGAEGASSISNTIQIGGGTGAGVGQQNNTFIAGIRGITTTLNDAIPVLIASNGQLGTTSSSREVKQDIREIGELSRRLLELRPVAFRYRQHAETDPGTPLQFGLIAEEVAEVFPDLVVRDGEGRPETVKYHLLAALLLNELQREHRLNQAQEAELARQRTEVLSLRDWLRGMEERPDQERRPTP